MFCVGRLAVSFAVLCCTACGDEGDTAAGAGGFDIDEKSLFGSGGLSLSGTVTLSNSVAAGAGAQIGIISGSTVPGSPWFGNELIGGRLQGAGATLRFRITNLDAGEYRVFARVDASGNGSFEEGDLGGYYAGSAENAVQDPAAATAVQLQADQEIAFGAATVP